MRPDHRAFTSRLDCPSHEEAPPGKRWVVQLDPLVKRYAIDFAGHTDIGDDRVAAFALEDGDRLGPVARNEHFHARALEKAALNGTKGRLVVNDENSSISG